MDNCVILGIINYNSGGINVVVNQEEVMAEKAAGISAMVTIATSGTVTVYGVVFQSIESLIGAAVMISSFLMMWYYNHKRTKILERQQDGK